MIAEDPPGLHKSGHVDARQARGVQAGDHGTQHNHFYGQAAPPPGVQPPIGTSIAECTPFALEVHPSIEAAE